MRRAPTALVTGPQPQGMLVYTRDGHVSVQLMYRDGEEIADAVLWLCSDAASYVTGQSISVVGGYVMRQSDLMPDPSYTPTGKWL